MCLELASSQNIGLFAALVLINDSSTLFRAITNAITFCRFPCVLPSGPVHQREWWISLPFRFFPFVATITCFRWMSLNISICSLLSCPIPLIEWKLVLTVIWWSTMANYQRTFSAICEKGLNYCFMLWIKNIMQQENSQ